MVDYFLFCFYIYFYYNTVFLCKILKKFYLFMGMLCERSRREGGGGGCYYNIKMVSINTRFHLQRYGIWDFWFENGKTLAQKGNNATRNTDFKLYSSATNLVFISLSPYLNITNYWHLFQIFWSERDYLFISTWTTYKQIHEAKVPKEIRYFLTL